MKGEASERAEWNRVVITDAIVPAFVNLLIHAKTKKTFNTQQYQQVNHAKERHANGAL